jgi:predicted  nucleic acid-binding Zn-ribbon protein
MQASECKHVWCLNDNAKFGVWFNCEKCGQKKRPNYLNELEATLQEAQDRIKQLKISVDDRGVRERYSANCAKELNQQVVSLKKINKEQLQQSQGRERGLREAIIRIKNKIEPYYGDLSDEISKIAKEALSQEGKAVEGY